MKAETTTSRNRGETLTGTARENPASENESTNPRLAVLEKQTNRGIPSSVLAREIRKRNVDKQHTTGAGKVLGRYGDGDGSAARKVTQIECGGTDRIDGLGDAGASQCDLWRARVLAM